MRNLIGRGYHDRHVPAVIQRNVLENPGGTPPIRLISRRSARAALRRC